MAPKWAYDKPYPTSPSPPDCELTRVLVVGCPDAPDVEALKRGVSRGGRWPWQAFDDTYSKSFANGKDGGNVGDSGVKGVQRQMGLDVDGQVGPDTFDAIRVSVVPEGLPHAGEPLLDATALKLLKEAAKSPPAPEGGGASALAQYARDSCANEPRIHYSQARPMTHLGVPPSQGFTADCSGHATGCYYEAGWPDPNKSGYNGYGWTGTLVNNPKVNSPYQVGDLALDGTSTGNTTHVVTCFVAGDSQSSQWVSHGSEAAPYPVALHYRDDLVCVVRPAK
jgi:hypothetical protein